MAKIPEVEAFLRAEQRLYAGLGLPEPRSTDMSVALPRGGPVNIRVAQIGSTDARPLVWVHGGGSCGASFARVIAAVEKREPNAFRHVIIDRPGCGASEAFTYWDEPDLKSHGAAVLRGVLDALDIEHAGFIANSMGALWSLSFANDEQRTQKAKSVDGLVLLGVPALLLDTSAPFPMRLCATPWIGLRLMRMDPGTREQAADVWKRLGHPDAARIGDDLLDLTAACARIPHWTESFVSLISQALRLGGARNPFRMEEWKRLDVPVHLVWGDRDPFGAVRSARLAVEARPKTKLDIVPGAGHLPWLDDVEVCVNAIVSMFEISPAKVMKASQKSTSATA